MAKFKEAIKKPFKAMFERPTAIKKLANNEIVTKVAIPITSIATSSAFAAKRIHDMKKQHEEELREYKKLADKIDDLSEKMDDKEKSKQKKKRTIFKKKNFSIDGGGFEKPSPKSVMAEGLKKIATESKFRSLDESDTSLEKSVRTVGDETCTIGQRPENTTARISAYQKGDVVVFLARYIGPTDVDRLGSILDSYCRTFRNADYSSVTTVDGSVLIELWVAEKSLDYLVKQLCISGFSLNVVL